MFRNRKGAYVVAVLAVGEDGAPDASLQLEAQRLMESG